jgi:protein subunit release factor B
MPSQRTARNRVNKTAVNCERKRRQHFADASRASNEKVLLIIEQNLRQQHQQATAQSAFPRTMN